MFVAFHLLFCRRRKTSIGTCSGSMDANEKKEINSVEKCGRVGSLTEANESPRLSPMAELPSDRAGKKEQEKIDDEQRGARKERERKEPILGAALVVFARSNQQNHPIPIPRRFFHICRSRRQNAREKKRTEKRKERRISQDGIDSERSVAFNALSQ